MTVRAWKRATTATLAAAPDQKLTMRKLIGGYTRDGAYTIFEDERRAR
jgi:hypothetical protein